MTRRGSRFSRVLRTIAWALLLAFAFGFLIGTWLRSELEKMDPDDSTLRDQVGRMQGVIDYQLRRAAATGPPRFR